MEIERGVSMGMAIVVPVEVMPKSALKGALHGHNSTERS